MTRSDGRLSGRLPELVAVAAVLVPGLLATAVAALFVSVLAAALPGAAAGLAEVAFALVVGVGVLGSLLVAGIAWLAVGRARQTLRSRLATHRVEWFRRWAHLESLVPPLRQVGLSSWLRPDEGTAVEVLRQRYVAGELDEQEFERELDRVLDGEDRDLRDGIEAELERVDRERGSDQQTVRVEREPDR